MMGSNSHHPYLFGETRNVAVSLAVADSLQVKETPVDTAAVTPLPPPTVPPTLVVIAMGLDPTRTLVISQVVLSFGLPFAVIPLVQFTRRKDIMGEMVNKPLTTFAAAVVAALIVALNIYLLVRTFEGGL